MQIVLVGASGVIGRAVADRLSRSHALIRVGHSDGAFRVDLGSRPSIEALFDEIGEVDAVISAAGVAGFGPFADLDDAAYDLALTNKLMGQVNLVRIGRAYVRDGGSFTLSAGILAREPIPGSIATSIANGGLESFAKAAALEMERGHRVNVVSPVLVTETMEKHGMDPALGLSAAETAKAYEAAVMGTANGEVLNTPDYA